MIARRGANRSPTFFGGTLRFYRGNWSVDCTVRNLSPEGAMIAVSDAVPLPTEADLSIPHLALHKRARIVWRRDRLAGIRYLPIAPRGVVVPFDRPRRAR
ncbi:PilZ domain-containing protein [Methylobacterium sp. ID0610]|uniref:PilZ domain-containing protein n=1 Tax=Methylobacterium carpenticola TaxID=3344827 RepID=UPI0036C9ED98